MLKELQSGLNKFFNRKEFVVAVIFVLIAFAMLSYTDTKMSVYDGYAGGDPYSHANIPGSYSEATNNLAKQPTVLETSAQHVVPSQENGSMGGDYQMKPVNNPDSLLPSDANSDWARLNPSMNAGTTPDLLQAGYHIGLDTIGQTLRNANLQLRSDPIIPKMEVGPWAQSTIEPDIARVPLEIGLGGR
jgi:hypothetical protein